MQIIDKTKVCLKNYVSTASFARVLQVFLSNTFICLTVIANQYLNIKRNKKTHLFQKRTNQVCKSSLNKRIDLFTVTGTQPKK